MTSDLDQMRAANQGNRPHLRRLYRPPITTVTFDAHSNNERLVAFMAKSDPVGKARFEFVALSIAAVTVFPHSAPHALRSITPFLAVPLHEELKPVINRLMRLDALFVGADLGTALNRWPTRLAETQNKMRTNMIDATVAIPGQPLPKAAPGNLEQMFYGTRGLVELVGKKWETESRREASAPLFLNEYGSPTDLTLGEAVLRTRGKLMSLFEWYEKASRTARPEQFESITGDHGPQLPDLTEHDASLSLRA